MLHYSVAHWGEFFGAALLLNLAPGPDLAFILGHTARGGTRHGLAAMLGVWTGVLCHIGFAVVGLSALIAASAEAFAIVKWIGVAYLVWLGVQALRSKGGFLADAGPVSPVSRRRVFGQGMLVNLLNPKVAIFYLTFLPQFISPGERVFARSLLLANIHIAMGFVWLTAYAWFIDRLGAVLTRPKVKAWLERVTGGLLIALGVRLAWERR